MTQLNAFTAYQPLTNEKVMGATLKLQGPQTHMVFLTAREGSRPQYLAASLA